MDKKGVIPKTAIIAIIAVVIIAAVAAILITRPPPPKPKIVAGFIYLGPVGDVGWTWNFDQARKYLENVFGADIKTFFAEAVPYPDGPRIAEEFILKEGVNVIIYNDAIEIWDPELTGPKKYPHVYWLHAAGFDTSLPNMATFYGVKMYEVRYLTGIVAGHMTKTNKIGYVAAHPIPEVLSGINAFTLGVRSVNPKATVHVTFIHSWYDPPLEKSAAESLLAIGCDILTQHADSPATQIAAQEAGKYSIGYQSDMSPFAPDAYLTGCVWDWRPILENIFRQILENRFENRKYLDLGMKEGVAKLGPWHPVVPKAVKDNVLALKEEMIAGRFHVFKGPLYDRDGVLRYPADYIPTIEEIWTKTYWVVEGVVGDIPPPKI